MIQSTNRLSRGARLRRGRPSWIYGLIALAGAFPCAEPGSRPTPSAGDTPATPRKRRAAGGRARSRRVPRLLRVRPWRAPSGAAGCSFEAGAADGFWISPDVYDDGIDAFVDGVVPILQQRGLFHRDYAGSTLRDHLGVSPQYGIDPRVTR